MKELPEYWMPISKYFENHYWDTKNHQLWLVRPSGQLQQLSLTKPYRYRPQGYRIQYRGRTTYLTMDRLNKIQWDYRVKYVDCES